MTTYTTREVAELLDWPESRVRGYVRDGLLNPTRQGRHFNFGFRDLVTLRAADELQQQGVAARHVKAGLRSLRHLLPDGRPLSAVRLATAGNRIVVREGAMLWEPETGQGQLDFSPDQALVPATELRYDMQRGGASSDQWYEQALALEQSDLGAAESAYAQAIDCEDTHADAHINLGRLLQQRGQRQEAEHHYRRALDLDPANPIAHFNLGTLFDEVGQQQAAIGHYQIAAETLPDAHYNLAQIFERMGDRQAAIRHLRALRMLWT